MDNNNRIVMIDALRGYALLGLFLVHMIEYFELFWLSPQPTIVTDTLFLIFGGKAYAMFALLFGVSLFIIMNNQQQKGVNFAPRFCWRLTLLLIMGLLHGLLYGGDILQILAITGLLLLPCYWLSSTAIFLLAAFFILQGPMLIEYIIIQYQGITTYTQPLAYGMHGSVAQVYATGSVSEVLFKNMIDGGHTKWLFMLETGRVTAIFGMGLLGLGLSKIGFFNNTHRFAKTLFGCIAVCLALSLTLYFYREHLATVIGTLHKGHSFWLISTVLTKIMEAAMTLFSITFFAAFFIYTPARKVLMLLAPCGRMSLTIYIGQSIIFVPIFYGFGLGGYTYFGQASALIVGLVFWVVQTAACHWWFKRYHFGPLEWCWRAATWLSTSPPFKRAYK